MIFVVIIFVTTGCSLNNNQQQEQKEIVFSNDLLNYEIEHKSPWRVSIELSKKFIAMSYMADVMYEIGCGESLVSLDTTEEDGNDAMDCLKNYPKQEELNKKLNQFLNNWNIQKSDMVILTNFTEEEERDFLLKIKNQEKNTIDIEFDKEISHRFISIYPSNFDMSFDEEKVNKSNDKISLKIMLLKNNINAYSIKTYSDGGLFVYVENPVSISSGEQVGLIFKMTSNNNEKSEEDFYEILNSLKLDNSLY